MEQSSRKLFFKEEKGLATPEAILEERKQRQLELAICHKRAESEEIRRAMADANIRSAVVGSPSFSREVCRTLNMILKFRDNFMEEFTKQNGRCAMVDDYEYNDLGMLVCTIDAKAFLELCNGFFDDIKANCQSFDFTSLRKFRQGVTKSFQKYFEAYSATEDAPEFKLEIA